MLAIWTAARPSVVLALTGRISAALAVLMCVPLAVSAVRGDTPLSVRLLAAIGIFAAAFLASLRLPRPDRIQRNEGMAVTALTFLFASGVMALPMAGAGLSAADAYFESASAITTTGLSTRGSIEAAMPSASFLRSWLQWCGGLGILVFVLALFQRPGSVARDLDLSDDSEGVLAGSTRAYARTVMRVYGALTVIGIAAFWPMLGDLRLAVDFALCTVSTGGFSPVDASLAELTGLQQTGVTLLCVACAIPLLVYSRAALRQEHARMRHREALVFLLLLVPLTAGFVASNWAAGAPWDDAMAHAVPMVASAASTAGFSTIDVAALDDGSKLVLVFAMVLGGCGGSTAGGFKIFRVLAIVQIVRWAVTVASVPRHAYIEDTGHDRRDALDELRGIVLIALLMLALVAIAWASFVVSGYDAVDSLFEVVSAASTVGLSAGLSDASLPTALKFLLCLLMLLGRLEFLVWLVAFSPRTWLGRRVDPKS